MAASENRILVQKEYISSLDLKKAKRAGLESKRINLDLPEWMLSSLDKEAHRIGTSRQSLIKFWVAEKLNYSH